MINKKCQLKQQCPYIFLEFPMIFLLVLRIIDVRSIAADLLAPLGPPGAPFGATCQRGETGLKLDIVHPQFLTNCFQIRIFDINDQGWAGARGTQRGSIGENNLRVFLFFS